MKILVDADGCPVVNQTVTLAKAYRIPVVLLCDTAHQLEREGAQTVVVSQGADSVDIALANRIQPRRHCCHPGLRTCRYLPEQTGTR